MKKKNEKTRFVFDARTLADLAEPLGLGILTKFLNKFSLNKNMARRQTDNSSLPPKEEGE